MAYSALMGELSYKLTMDTVNFDYSVKKVKSEIQGLTPPIKSLARDIGILGGSLASVGGLAIGAGLALGDSGLGKSLTSAGMGLSVVGGMLSTIQPALKGMAVVIEGQVVPALIAMNAFLGPTGWLVIGIGLAASAIGYFALKSKDAKQSIADQIQVNKDNTDSLKDMADAYNAVIDAQNELAGVTKSLEDRQLDLVEAKNADARAQQELDAAFKSGDQLRISEAGARKLRTAAAVREAEASLSAYPTDVAAAEERAKAAGEAYTREQYYANIPTGGPAGPSPEAAASLEAMSRAAWERQGYKNMTSGVTVGTINISVNSTQEAADVATFVDSRLVDRYGAKAMGVMPP